jgi:hypothetical protein
MAMGLSDFRTASSKWSQKSKKFVAKNQNRLFPTFLGSSVLAGSV